MNSIFSLPRVQTRTVPSGRGEAGHAQTCGLIPTHTVRIIQLSPRLMINVLTLHGQIVKPQHKCLIINKC